MLAIAKAYYFLSELSGQSNHSSNRKPLLLSSTLSTQGLVERGGFNRPDWLDFAVHGGNSLAAWGDLLLAPSRSFSTASLTLSIGLGTLYLTWCMIVRIGYGKVRDRVVARELMHV